MEQIAKKRLIEVLILEIEKSMKNIGKPITWLRFARPLKNGYRFLPHKEAQWKVLERIANSIVLQFPQYTTGEITDILCEIVNQKKS